MKKLIPVFVAIVLILIVVAAGFGTKLIDKYSYSKERADLEEYFGLLEEDDVAIIMQDAQVEEYAKIWDGICYFDFATVHKYFNDRFYEDKLENLLLYTTPDSIIRTEIGTTVYSVSSGGAMDTGYVIARYEGDVLYVAAEYVKKYTNFSYKLFSEPYHVQVDTEWDERQVADILKDTQVRYQGGIKSDILTDVGEGDSVIILEEMENWTKVKTQNSYIGYVENKRLSEKYSEKPVPVTDYVEPEYTSISKDYTINLAWHAIYSMGGNDTLNEVLLTTQAVNTISPTWFILTGNQGDFTSLASKEYVSAAHDRGLEVWALISNITDTETVSYTHL
ncbi:MAG: SH3 domain-containing protein, partial [Lachnospiraceae bacterium]|nr:SH3 domain-containing protein [Lachnospiraceae bacterium]